MLHLPALAERTVWRIAFGSCAKQRKPQPIWRAVEAAAPDLFVFLGDNFYADAETPEALRQRHADFAREAAELQAFRRRVPHLAIWDDHDYGVDDAGAEYPHKRLSQQLFCDTWGEPGDSPRRTRDGIYTACRLAAGGRSVQLLLPDLRFNRTPLVTDSQGRRGYDAMLLAARLGSRTPVPGWYRPNPDPQATMLGEAQWHWLGAQLRQPADVRLLCSSVQLAAEGSGWEGWANYPADRERLRRLLIEHRAERLLAISGDMHYGELSRWHPEGAYPLWDLTSSGLTEVWPVATPNASRVRGVLAEPNFGLVQIDWDQQQVTLSVQDQEGRVRLMEQVALRDLAFPPR